MGRLKLTGMPDYDNAAWLVLLSILTVTSLGLVPPASAIEIYPTEISRFVYDESHIISFSGQSDAKTVKVTYTNDNNKVTEDKFPTTDANGNYRGFFIFYIPPRVGEHTIKAEGDPIVGRFSVINIELPDPCLSLDCDEGKVQGYIDADTISTPSKPITFALIDVPKSGEVKYKEAREFIENTCKKGFTFFYDVDDKQPESPFTVPAEVFCNKKSINHELMARGLARIIVDLCDKSEFASKNWAQDCHNDDGNIDQTGGVREELATPILDPVDPGSGDSENPDGSGDSDTGITLVGLVNSLVDFFVSHPFALAIPAAVVTMISVAAWKRNKSRSGVVIPPSSPPSSPPSQSTNEAPTNQFYECPMCHNPDLVHNTPSQKHLQGWTKCKCGFKFDFAKGMEF